MERGGGGVVCATFLAIEKPLLTTLLLSITESIPLGVLLMGGAMSRGVQTNASRPIVKLMECLLR